MALCDQMTTDGIDPVRRRQRRQVAGRWACSTSQPAHSTATTSTSSLMAGKESWTDDKVKDDLHQLGDHLADHMQPERQRPHVAGRRHRAGEEGSRHVLARHLRHAELRPGHRSRRAGHHRRPRLLHLPRDRSPSTAQDAVEAPIDGFMMAANPKNPEGAKALLAGLGPAAAIDAYIAVNPAVGRRQLDGRHRGVQQDPGQVGRAGRLGEVHRPVPRPRHRPRLRFSSRRRCVWQLHRGSQRRSTRSCRHRRAEGHVHVRLMAASFERWAADQCRPTRATAAPRKGRRRRYSQLTPRRQARRSASWSACPPSSTSCSCGSRPS